jgi:predicted outer membrane repeat protein
MLAGKGKTMPTKYVLTILVLLALAVPAAPAQAGGVVTVCDEAHLLVALAGGGTVTFACSGTITLTAEIVITADTTIDGSGQDVTISGNNAVRVFYVNSGVTLMLNGLTVANGYADWGGGINNRGTLVVNNSTFFGNSVAEPHGNGGGGGVYNQGIATVANSTFSGNSAQDEGGAINNKGGTLTVGNSTFSGNYTYCDYQCSGGGAIFNDDSMLTVIDSDFEDNHAGGASALGGGICNEAVYTLTVSNSTFSGNSAAYGGGGISAYTVSVSNSTFSGNHAFDGGGIYASTVSVSNSTFSGNRAGNVGGGVGGGIWCLTLTVSNSTFSGNSASGGGGVFICAYCSDSDPSAVSNSTFSGNSANSGGGIHNSAALIFGGSELTVSNGTFAANSGGGIYNGSGSMVTLKNTMVTDSLAGNNCSGTITDGGGNLSYPDTTCPGINADPVLGPLQNNGGPTDTMALGEGSAAIDAADDTICAAPPVNNLDQRGFPRPWGAHCDIGAVEQIQEPSAVSVSALRAQSLPGTITPAMVAGLLLLVLAAVGSRRRPRHIG